LWNCVIFAGGKTHNGCAGFIKTTVKVASSEIWPEDLVYNPTGHEIGYSTFQPVPYLNLHLAILYGNQY
jgi:hypothetical protein